MSHNMPVDHDLQVILVVDDEPVNIEVLNEILQNDYRVLFATNGKDAMELAVVDFPNLILLDVMMPDVDGFTICTWLRDNERTHDIPVIIVTAMNDPNAETRGFVSGAVDFLSKPVNPHAVRARVAYHLALKKQRTDLEMVNTRLQMEIKERQHFEEQLPDLLIEVDKQGHVTFWNHAAESILGLSRKQTLGNQFLDLPLQWDWLTIFDALDQVITRGETVAIPKMRYIHPLGHVLHLEISFICFDERPKRKIMILGSDITEKLAMETHAFHTSKLEAVGTLAAGIAHEINTPVQFIGDNFYFLKDAFADLARILDGWQSTARYLREGTWDQARQAMDDVENEAKTCDLAYLLAEAPEALLNIQQGVERISVIVRAMKDFSYQDWGEAVHVDINKALQDTAIITHNEYKYVADLELTLDPALPAPTGFRTELNQTFLNLLVNAAHAVAEKVEKDGGGRGRITIATSVENHQVVIRFSDTGIGIPENIRDRIFEPFFTTKPVGKGTGQGLAITHNIIVRKHGGTIQVESQPGLGSTFTIRLPVEPLNKPFNSGESQG